jgi:hypothetical protein
MWCGTGHRGKERWEWQARRAVRDMVGLLLESHTRGLVDDLEPGPEPWLCASLHPPRPRPGPAVVVTAAGAVLFASTARGRADAGPSSRARCELRLVVLRVLLCHPWGASHSIRDGRGRAGRLRLAASIRGTLGGFGQHAQWVRWVRVCWNSLDALGSCTIHSATPVAPSAPASMQTSPTQSPTTTTPGARHDDYCPQSDHPVRQMRTNMPIPLSALLLLFCSSRSSSQRQAACQYASSGRPKATSRQLNNNNNSNNCLISAHPLRLDTA